MGEPGEHGVMKAGEECFKEEGTLPKPLVDEDKGMLCVWRY